MTQDIRWKQRFQNFLRSLAQLDTAMALMEERELNDLEKQGVIQAFEYNYELAWNVIKDYYEYQGDGDGQGIQGSRDAFRIAFKRGLIADGKVWMDMIKSRARSSHTYNEDTAEEVLEEIVDHYYPAFQEFKQTMTRLAEKND